MKRREERSFRVQVHTGLIWAFRFNRRITDGATIPSQCEDLGGLACHLLCHPLCAGSSRGTLEVVRSKDPGHQTNSECGEGVLSGNL